MEKKNIFFLYRSTINLINRVFKYGFYHNNINSRIWIDQLQCLQTQSLEGLRSYLPRKRNNFKRNKMMKRLLGICKNREYRGRFYWSYFVINLVLSEYVCKFAIVKQFSCGNRPGEGSLICTEITVWHR